MSHKYSRVYVNLLQQPIATLPSTNAHNISKLLISMSAFWEMLHFQHKGNSVKEWWQKGHIGRAHLISEDLVPTTTVVPEHETFKFASAFVMSVASQNIGTCDRLTLSTMWNCVLQLAGHVRKASSVEVTEDRSRLLFALNDDSTAEIAITPCHRQKNNDRPSDTVRFCNMRAGCALQ